MTKVMKESEENKQKHTPGPWSVYGAPDELIIHDEDREVIGIIPRFKGASLKQQEKSEANAQLIAAAPEMLEALQFALSVMKEKGIDYSETAAIEKAEKAIQKATS